MALAPRTWLYLVCLWLSIATALGHAVVPAGSPLERGQGSAFSASTTDVSLGLSRAAPAKIKRTTLAPDDHGAAPDVGPPLLVSLSPSSFVVRVVRTPPAPHPAPPLSPFPLAHGFDARGPPRA